MDDEKKEVLIRRHSNKENSQQRRALKVERSPYLPNGKLHAFLLAALIGNIAKVGEDGLKTLRLNHHLNGRAVFLSERGSQDFVALYEVAKAHGQSLPVKRTPDTVQE